VIGDYKMTIKLSSKGGSGVFVASKSYPVEIITAGATGTFKTLTPPTGKRIKVTILNSQGTPTSLTTVTVGGSDVVTSVILAGGISGVTNQWVITQGVNFIIGNIDEAVELKTNVATTQNIVLMYQEGV
tara:strand:+ start:1625 stop:2011 length:387 start_codon:yes stop_codon:yes gene_type:complete